MAKTDKPDNVARVLAVLTELAEAGKPAPTRNELGDRTGLAASSTHKITGKLVQLGEISIEIQHGWQRRITICATGARTDWSASWHNEKAAELARIIDAILAEAHAAIAEGRAMVPNRHIAEQVGCTTDRIEVGLAKLVESGRMKKEGAGDWRRVCLDGVWMPTRVEVRRKAKAAAKKPKPEPAPQRTARPKPQPRRPDRTMAYKATQAGILRQALYDLLVSLAESNAELLSTADLAARLKASEGEIDAAMRQLKLAHSIYVETEGNRRRVVIGKTGAATDWMVPGPPNRGMDMSLVNPTWQIPADCGGKFGRCQYLHGEPRDRNFCGQPTQDGSSYCVEHHARCHTKLIVTRRRAA